MTWDLSRSTGGIRTRTIGRAGAAVGKWVRFPIANRVTISYGIFKMPGDVYWILGQATDQAVRGGAGWVAMYIYLMLTQEQWTSGTVGSVQIAMAISSGVVRLECSSHHVQIWSNLTMDMFYISNMQPIYAKPYGSSGLDNVLSVGSIIVPRPMPRITYRNRPSHFPFSFRHPPKKIKRLTTPRTQVIVIQHPFIRYRPNRVPGFSAQT